MRKIPLILIALTAFAGLVPQSHAVSGNGGRGGGYALLCYKHESVYREVSTAALRQTLPWDEAYRQPEPIDLHLEDLRYAPVVVDYYEAIRPRFRDPDEAMASGSWGKPEEDPADPRMIFESAKQDAESWVYAPLGIATRKQRPSDPDGFWELFSRTRTTPEDWSFDYGGVPRVPDARFERGIPKNCAYVQLAFFDDGERKVRVDARIFRLLNRINRMTLWVHEDLTHYYRAGVRQCLDTVDNLIAYSKVWLDRPNGLATYLRLASNDPRCEESPMRPGCPNDRCLAPSLDTTDPARKLVVNLLSKSSSSPYLDERFKFLVREISLSVEIGYGSFTVPEDGDEFIESKWQPVTYLVRRVSRRRVVQISPREPLYVMPTFWFERRLRGQNLVAPFPPQFLDTK